METLKDLWKMWLLFDDSVRFANYICILSLIIIFIYIFSKKENNNTPENNKYILQYKDEYLYNVQPFLLTKDKNKALLMSGEDIENFLDKYIFIKTDLQIIKI